jgi:hypothetical protein
MKTDDLIEALVADTGRRTRPLGRTLAMACAAGIAVATAAFAATMGVREDIGEVLGTWPFRFKLALVVLLGVVAVWTVRDAVRPVARGNSTWGWGVVGAVAMAGVGVELASVPAADWGERLMGDNALLCLTRGPALAAVPLVCLLAWARTGAPRAPSVAGATAGCLAAAVGLSLYALHCTDDSPLFVVTWYGLATAIVVATGALVGGRVLRW